MNEITPPRFKILMRSGGEFVFNMGYTYTAVLASCQDADLRQVNWRTLILSANLLPLVMAIVSFVYLPESPVYLASRGLQFEAAKVFNRLRRLNGVPEVSVAAQVQELKQNRPAPIKNPYGVVLGPHYRRTTVILSYTAFVVNMYSYGGTYAMPQVMTKGRGMARGWEIVVGGPFNFIGIVVAVVLDSFFNRRMILSFALLMASLTISCFGWAGSEDERSTLLEFVYQFGVFGFYWVPALCFIIFGQLAVASFPPLASATGASCAFTTGRVGALISPIIFEHIMMMLSNHWAYFCYFSAVLSFMAAMLLAFTPLAGEESYEAPPDRSKPLASSAPVANFQTSAAAEEGASQKLV